LKSSVQTRNALKRETTNCKATPNTIVNLIPSVELAFGPSTSRCVGYLKGQKERKKWQKQKEQEEKKTTTSCALGNLALVELSRPRLVVH
jgi:hypothetical protein